MSVIATLTNQALRMIQKITPSNLISFNRLFFLIGALAGVFASCDKDDITPMRQFYNESVNLQVATLDSITRFCDKFGTYVTFHPDSRRDAYYPPTLDNLKAAASLHGCTIQLAGIKLNLNPAWEDEIEIHF